MVRQQKPVKGRRILGILVSLGAVATSGAIFIVALFQQFALVEVAASLLTGLQVFFLSAAISDHLEKRKDSSRARSSGVIFFTLFLVVFYSFTRYLR